MAASGPGSYEIHLKDKKREPAFSMGARISTIDKKVTPGAGSYDLPSKVVEKPGKSMGIKLESAMVKRNSAAEPGPGGYNVDKSKSDNF